MDRSASSLFSWLLVPVAALLVLSAVSLPQRPYTGLVQRDAEVISVLPGSPAARAGARPGDRLVGAPGTTRSAAALANGATPGRPIAVTVERDGARRSLWLVPEPLPSGDRRMMAALLLVGSGFVMLGGWVWSERRDPMTRTFLLLCLSFAWLLAPLPQWNSRPAVAAFEVALSGVTVYLPALFMHFFALFPDRAARGGVRALVRTGYAVSTALFIASLAVQFEPRRGATSEAVALALQTAAALWFGAGLLAAFVLFATAFRGGIPFDTRRRLRVAFVGTVLGAGPLAAFIVIRNLAPSLPLPGEGFVVLLTLLVPASFAWAAVVHSVFDFRVALRIGIVMMLLAAFGAALYVAGEAGAALWWPDLGNGILGAALALLTVSACVAGPIAPWLRSFGSRVIPETRPDAISLAAWVSREPGLSGHSVERVLQDACNSMMRALRLDGCGFVTLDASRAPVVAFTGTLGRLAPPGLPKLDRAPLEYDGVRGLEGVGFAADVHGALERAGVRWVLPIGHEPVRAVALLGGRLAGSWLARHEVFELERFAEHLGVTLENAALRREAHGRLHIDRELREAGAIQAHLLPRRAPVFPTLDCAAAALSSESVGGDYYDFVEGPGRDFTLAVGDAAGKGIPAALLLAGVQARFRTEAHKGRTPGQLLDVLNRELVGLDQPEKFVGLLCARFEVRTGRLCFANAGLTPPLLRRRDGTCEELTASGVLLGVSLRASYPDECAVLGAGDLVVIYTDGLTEARRGDELFGVEGVRRVLDMHAGRRAADILEALLGEVRAFTDRSLDDVTVVVLRQLTGGGLEPATQSKTLLKWLRLATDT